MTSETEEKSAEPKKKRRAEKSDPTEYWPEMRATWIRVYGDLLPEIVDEDTGELCKAVPEIDGPEYQHMKYLIKSLKQRAIEKKVEWTKEEALKRWELFIRKAWEDDFISKNFMLRIVNNNKSKIFNNQITPKKYVNNYRPAIQSSHGNKPVPTIVAEGGFGKL